MGDEGCGSPGKRATGAVFRDGGVTVDVCAQRAVNPRARESQLGQVTHGLKQDSQKPDKEVIDMCWGDAHSAGIKPLSFVRQVLAGCLHPELLHSDRLSVDARQRAQRLLGACDGGSVGSYTPVYGLPHVQRSVAEFITRRDGGVACLPENIIISSEPLRLLLFLLAAGEGASRAGVLTPAPVCHTVAVALAEVGVVSVPYPLCEERGWALQANELRGVLQASRGRCDPRALYVANPGDPTGHVQSRDSIEEVIRLAAEERLFLLVNEADQDSVHGEGCEFVSYRKVLSEMGPGFSDTVELASLHSISRGFMGEGGLCSGYMELLNVDPAVAALFPSRLLTPDISTPVLGQLALDVMVKPPRPGDPSHPTYAEEVRSRRETLMGNVRRVQEVLDALPGVSCVPGLGGHYTFPRLHLPRAALEQAESAGVEADQFYCRKLLEQEGVCVRPGCEFGQSEGTHHIRLHVMVPPEVLEEALVRLKRFHLRFMREFS
ncbi:alanine aminotransferase 2-like isoform X2 [Conger conger]|uniref:alanine aminotransferase 2-like isoform X2 n=1 Tax=Conger conger TaxID=82655 RepID=UPI002A5A42C1|nr:alanine aminotransferase 2-like isoform X2 [Conger conger]